MSNKQEVQQCAATLPVPETTARIQFVPWCARVVLVLKGKEGWGMKFIGHITCLVMNSDSDFHRDDQSWTQTRSPSTPLKEKEVEDGRMDWFVTTCEKLGFLFFWFCCLIWESSRISGTWKLKNNRKLHSKIKNIAWTNLLRCICATVRRSDKTQPNQSSPRRHCVGSHEMPHCQPL